MSHADEQGSSTRMVIAIAVLLCVYGIACWKGIPQEATRQIVAGESGAEAKPPTDSRSGEAGHQSAGDAKSHPPYFMIAPFALLLIGIAVFPLTPRVADWWDNNLHRFYVAFGLGFATLLYYAVAFEHPVEGHFPAGHIASPSAGGLNLVSAWTVFENAIFGEYIPFIALLFTLYTICGGIRIEGDQPAHPMTNAVFIAAGALLASIIGTTGAAMLLIRPLLDTNRQRRHVKHTVVFFIFAVCNCGGCLLPLGDPPLFLGYLRGVDFLWTLHLWREWLFVNGMLIAIYIVWDRFWFYPQESIRDIVQDETRVTRMRFRGLWPNVLLLAAVVASIGLLDPAKPLPGTDWHPWLYLREAIQLLLVLISLVAGSRAVRLSNNFNYHAITEVAVLFLGIFICMQPPLQILHVEGPSLGLTTPAHFFWAAGSLSAVLDNAPTYVVFFTTAQSLGGNDLMAGVQQSLLIGVSLGAVFGGAMTYIGNGPNFMVKAIAEKSGVAMPSFFGYMLYSFGILLPLFLLTSWLLI